MKMWCPFKKLSYSEVVIDSSVSFVWGVRVTVRVGAGVGVRVISLRDSRYYYAHSISPRSV